MPKPTTLRIEGIQFTKGGKAWAWNRPKGTRQKEMRRLVDALNAKPGVSAKGYSRHGHGLWIAYPVSDYRGSCADVLIQAGIATYDVVADIGPFLIT